MHSGFFSFSLYSLLYSSFYSLHTLHTLHCLHSILLYSTLLCSALLLPSSQSPFSCFFGQRRDSFGISQPLPSSSFLFLSFLPLFSLSFLPLSRVCSFSLHLSFVSLSSPSFFHLSPSLSISLSSLFILSLHHPSLFLDFHLSSIDLFAPPSVILLSIPLYFFALDYPLFFPSSTSLSPLRSSLLPIFLSSSFLSSFSLSSFSLFSLFSSLPPFLSLSLPLTGQTTHLTN